MGAASPRKQQNPFPSFPHISHFQPNSTDEIKPIQDQEVINGMLQSNDYQTLLSPEAYKVYQMFSGHNGKPPLFVNKLENFEIIDMQTQKVKFRGQRRVTDKVIEGFAFYFENQVFYQGYFLNGFKHYFGKQIWDDGSYYVGGFVNDLYDGEGIYLKNIKQENPFTFEYQGEFKEGQIINGTLNKKDSNKNLLLSYKGQFKDFKMHGEGQLSFKGKIYKGMFSEDRKHGLGREFDEDMIGYRKGNWEKGRKQGLFVYKREGTQSVEEYHRDQRK